MRFGELVMQLLEERGMTQIELARRSGLSRPHINRIIKGGIEYPSIEFTCGFATSPRLLRDYYGTRRK